MKINIEILPFPCLKISENILFWRSKRRIIGGGGKQSDVSRETSLYF
jgi:hypothetical protein